MLCCRRRGLPQSAQALRAGDPFRRRFRPAGTRTRLAGTQSHPAIRRDGMIDCRPASGLPQRYEDAVCPNDGIGRRIGHIGSQRHERRSLNPSAEEDLKSSLASTRVHGFWQPTPEGFPYRLPYNRNAQRLDYHARAAIVLAIGRALAAGWACPTSPVRCRIPPLLHLAQRRSAGPCAPARRSGFGRVHRDA